jgi:hypothetical protein
MARGPIKSRYALAPNYHPNLALTLSILEAGPHELAAEGCTYGTVWGLLHAPKDPSLRTALIIVSALRAVAARRAAKGLASVPLESITVEAIFPLSRLPSTLRRESIEPGAEKCVPRKRLSGETP